MKKISIFLFAVVLNLFLLVACGGGTTTPEKVEPKANQATPPAEQKAAQTQTYKVGDTVKMGDLQFTLNSVTLDKGNEFMKPDQGKKWVVFDGTVENLGSQSTTISSMLMFSVVDSKGYKADLSIGANTKGQLDGELGSGRKMSGQIAFELDANEKALEFIFEPNVFGFGQAIYKVDAP